jgi:tetratricopeptide (TPR) repeat protein
VLLVLLGYSVLRRSAQPNLYLFCIVWWIVTLSPALLNLDQVIGEAHDRYEYLGSFGFCVILSDWAVRFLRRDAFRRRLVVALGTALTIVYVVTLWRVEPVWHDNLTLYTHVVEAIPSSAHFRLALASELERDGQTAAALTQFQQVEKITPDDANIHLFLGLLYLKLHRSNDATSELAAYYRAAFGLKKPAKRRHWYVEFK